VSVALMYERAEHDATHLRQIIVGGTIAGSHAIPVAACASRLRLRERTQWKRAGHCFSRARP
jgi:hypothetical protein